MLTRVAISSRALRACFARAMLIVAILSPGAALGNINVEVRPYFITAAPLGAVNVGIFLVSDSCSNQSTAAADIMFGWDPTRLHLLGLSTAGGPPAIFSGFPNDGGDVNEVNPPQDGTGYYLFLGSLGTPAQATPAGILLATLQFQALVPTLCGGTTVSILPVAGNSPPRFTIVYDGIVPGLPVTGTLGSCSALIGPQLPDTQPPVINGCPSSVSVNAAPGQCSAIVSWAEPTVMDNCAARIARVGCGPPNGGAFPVGTTTVTYQATDFAGNSGGTCSFTVTVIDTQNPTISNCPANIVRNTDGDGCSAIVTWTPPTAADNCAIASLVPDHPPGSAFPLGTTTVIYTATDTSGHTAMCSFTVTVQDHENPAFSFCPGPTVTVSAPPNQSSAVVTWPTPTAVDNCPGVTAVQTGGPALGSTQPIGSYGVTYTATDGAGNTAMCNFTVVVQADQPPMINGCPTNIQANTGPGVCTATVSWTEPTVSDDFGATLVRIDNGPPNGGAFPVGTTTVQYQATDASNNTAFCTFNVTVTDNQNPVIAGCPGNIMQASDPGLCTAVVSWTSPTVSDNCGVQSFTSNHLPGDVFPIGMTTVTYQALDTHGRMANCSFTVTVEDEEPPDIAGCPSDIVVHNNTMSCNAIVNWTAPIAADNCGTVASFNSDHAPGETFANFTTTTVTYTATDDSGNASTCVFTVTVLPLPDIDNDGDFDSDDVPLFVNVLLGTDTTPLRVFRSDVNCDGSANGLDVQPFTDLLVP